MAGAFRVGHKVVLHSDALLLFNVDPTLWKEGVRVWKYVWVDLMEDGCHANDGLGAVSCELGNL